jgi:uncharacterized protein YbgA (DUF1722 family)/uncharacterized protein YbbK (DUF523 family)
MVEKIKIAVSSCLLGKKVRYNGGHKGDHFLIDVLGNYVEYVPVCPELEIGLGVPREPVRLVGDPDSPRLVTQKTAIDHTDRMTAWTGNRLDRLGKNELCGFILKSKSPSCGIGRVKVYDEKGRPGRTGIGIFARTVLERWANLPVEDEGRLQDTGLRENFIVRVFTYHRWRRMLKTSPSPGGLVDFHTRNKLIYMAHHPEYARQLGKLTAQAKHLDREELFNSYESLLMKCLAYKATTRKNANVLYHMLGYFKKHLDPEDKQELVETIENYRLNYIPLVVPVTLFKHYVRKYRQPYLLNQYYLDPQPLELKLRNHA